MNKGLLKSLGLGALLTISGYTLGSYHESEAQENLNSVPKRIHQVRKEILEIEQLPKRELLDNLLNPEFVEKYLDLRNEFIQYNTLHNGKPLEALEAADVVNTYYAFDGATSAAGVCFLGMSVAYGAASLTNNRIKKRRR